MKRKNEFEEFIEQLEEAVDSIIDEIDTDKPVNIDISINLCPMALSGYERRTEDTPVDILETDKNLFVVIALHGMGNIEISCSGKALEIRASNGEKSVREVVELPSKVNKKGMKSTYKNGILEIVLNKTRSKSRKVFNQ